MQRTFDYVQIADGASINSYLGGRFCGSSRPAPFISSGNFLTVQFVSDISIQMRGFNATYTFVDMPCGGTYNATSMPQNTSSPQLSNIRRPFSTCTWVIEAPPHQQVQITVWKLQLPSQDCSRSSLELQDSEQTNGNQVTQFCGANYTTLPVFYSSGNYRSCLFSNLNFKQKLSNCISPMKIADCHREIHPAFGNLKNPGLASGYANNLDCSYILRAPQNHRISLFFYWFQLEDSRQCMNDFLEVRNGSSSSSPLLGKYCSNLLPNPIFSQSNELYLHFHSDDSDTHHGYEIIWASSPTGCGRTLLGNEGILTNPGFPDSYPNNTHCEWTILAPSGKALSVGFPFLSINLQVAVNKNYSSLHGPNSTPPPLDRLLDSPVGYHPFHAFIQIRVPDAQLTTLWTVLWHRHCGSTLFMLHQIGSS
uniref:CUB domain-containing protein n=1 Tax=Mus musculus TaxID=10090 RepID=O89002_MOUSE|nr:hypothetical protein [Mus musculus]